MSDQGQLPVRDRHAQALAALGGTASPVPALAMPAHSGLDGLISILPGTEDAPGRVVKTFHRAALAPYAFAGAAEAAALAGGIGIGPDLLSADPATATLVGAHPGGGWRTAMVPDFLEPERLALSADPATATLVGAHPGGGWRTAMVPDFLEPERLAALMALKRRWHGAGSVAAATSPRAVFDALAARLAAEATLPLPATVAMTPAELGQWVARIAGAIEAAGSDPVLLHGENMVSNVLCGPDGALRLLDFDRAAMGDAYWDLGALSVEFCVDDTDRAALLEAYLGHAPAADQMARLKLYALLDDAIWAVWAILGEADPERRGPELYKYACNRLVRLRLHLSIFDMAKLLREV
ncbi:phosphotransferase [Frigidibacter sp. MR17.24]